MTEGMMSDGVGQRRIEERTACDIEATIELSDRLAIPCRIKDLSMQGFKLQIDAAVFLPEEFDLLIPLVANSFRRYRVKMAWRSAAMLGGEIVTPFKQPTTRNREA